ncbi:hypothetical protein JF546_21605 [Nitratireductor aquimarinus]|nr:MULTISPECIES: hypothetical protein [Nitratireductor]MBN8245620.1 hypothetical protein [Nitratireductor aquimarinus]MBY6134002.1 hypothetical protein [Nitratireductor aquimarinus]MCA1302953.1 hypothetical protein [Nitratireductor aquimarinus]MCV0378469.1 hypothetical protein [Nitratireductor sp.]
MQKRKQRSPEFTATVALEALKGEMNLALMRQIDRQFLEMPFFDVRR